MSVTDAQVRAALQHILELPDDFPGYVTFLPGKWGTPEEEAAIHAKVDARNMATMRAVLETAEAARPRPRPAQVPWKDPKQVVLTVYNKPGEEGACYTLRRPDGQERVIWDGENAYWTLADLIDDRFKAED